MEKKIATAHAKKPAAKKAAPAKPASVKEKYVEGIGRRKTSVARVRMYPKEIGKKGQFDVTVNGKPYTKYFPLEKQRKTALAPFTATEENFRVTVVAKGGGLHGQVEAVRMGLSRALAEEKADYRSRLRALGYLTRDPRMVERKKFGSRKARRPQQWRKR